MIYTLIETFSYDIHCQVLVCHNDLGFIQFYCCANGETNSSTAVSLQGFSKEAASGPGMVSLRS